MIHEAFTKSEIAKRYYSLRGIELAKEPARKRFILDKNIDKKLILIVINSIYKEQKKMLK